jgi:hypothetical protein
MWESWRLTTLRVSTAWYGDSFILLTFIGAKRIHPNFDGYTSMEK